MKIYSFFVLPIVSEQWRIEYANKLMAVVRITTNNTTLKLMLLVMYDCMITRITTRGRIYCFEKWILFFVAQEIWTKVIYRSHEEYKIFFSKLSLFLNCHENRKPNIYLYLIYFSLGTIQRMYVFENYAGMFTNCYYFLLGWRWWRQWWLHCINIIFLCLHLSSSSN